MCDILLLKRVNFYDKIDRKKIYLLQLMKPLSDSSIPRSESRE